MKRATIRTIPSANCEGISIHALVKRATVAVPDFVLSYTISIHALVKRATFPSVFLYSF